MQGKSQWPNRSNAVMQALIFIRRTGEGVEGTGSRTPTERTDHRIRLRTGPGDEGRAECLYFCAKYNGRNIRRPALVAWRESIYQFSLG